MKNNEQVEQPVEQQVKLNLKPPRYINKTQRQEIFEVYYAMGPRRTLYALAERLNVPYSRVLYYSSTNHWKLRIVERDAEVARRVADEGVMDAVQTKRKYILANEKLIDDFIQKIENGTHTIKETLDFLRTQQQQLLLLGESTDNVLHKFNFQVTEIVKKADGTEEEIQHEREESVERILQSLGEEDIVEKEKELQESSLARSTLEDGTL